jgi:outer membrane protein assembly factor BamB
MSQVKQQLLNTVDVESSLAGCCVTGGRLNVHNALQNQSSGNIWASIAFPYQDTVGMYPVGKTVTVTGVANSTQFVNYTLKIGEGASPSSWSTSGVTLVNGGTAAVPSQGPLATVNIPATVEGVWTLCLTVNSTNGSQQALQQIWVDPYLRAGFPVYDYESAGSYTSGANSIYTLVAPVLGDGHQQILASALSNGPLYAWDSQGNLLPGWPVDGGGVAYAAAKDVNGSGRASVAATFFAGTTWGLLDSSGNYLTGWPIANPNFASTAPTMADVLGNGQAETIVNLEDWYVRVYAPDGVKLSGWPQEGKSGQRLPATVVGDLLGDGQEKILAFDGYSSAGLFIDAWNANGTPVTGWPVQVSSHDDIYGGLAMGDVTGNGVCKVVVCHEDTSGQVNVLLPNGTEAPGWPFSIPGSSYQTLTPPALADLTGEGIPAIIFGVEDMVDGTACVYALKGDGTVLPGWPQSAPDGYTWVGNFAPVVGDISGSGEPAVVMGYSYPGSGTESVLVAYSPQGQLLSGFPKYIQAGSGSVPAIADLDGVGRNQLILESSAWSGLDGLYPKVFVWDYNPPGMQSGSIEWGQLRNDSGHSGFYTLPTQHIPVITSPLTATVALGGNFSYTIQATGSPGTFGASNLPANLGVDTYTGVISGTPETLGNFNIPISAANNYGAGNAVLVLTVFDPNVPVIAGTSPASPFTMYATTSQTFAVTASSPINSTLSYAWQLDSAAVGANQATYLYSPGLAAIGSHSLKVTVTDASSRTTNYTWQILVRSPAPVIGSYSPTSPCTMYATTSQAFSATATSPIGLPLSYAWKLDAGVVGSNLSSYQYSPAQSAVGSHALQITATDSAGQSVSFNWQISVQNPVPIITNASPASPCSMLEATVQIFTVTANSPIGLTLSYAWQLDSAAAGSNQSTFQYSPGQNLGSHSLQVTVSDTGGRSASSSWQITVLSGSGTIAWPTMGNGPAHTSYVPFILPNSSSVQDWSVTLGSSSIFQVAVGDGLVFATTEVYFQSTSLVALNAATGKTVWSFSFGDSASVGPPTYADGMVFVQQVTPTEAANFFAFNAVTGAVVWCSPWTTQWATFYAPTVSNGSVYIGGGEYGGMYGFNEASGDQLFFNDLGGMAGYDEWTPTYWNGRLFAWTGDTDNYPCPITFYEINTSSGNIIWSLTLPDQWDGYSMNTVTAVDNGYAYVIAPGGVLYAINLSTDTQAWSAPGPYTGSPAVANGVVYAMGQNNSVRALNATTGQFLQTYYTPAALQFQPIVSQNLLICASASETYILNLSDGTLLTTLPYGGSLSVAGTQLFIATSSGQVLAYTLQDDVPVLSSLQATPNPTQVGTAVTFNAAASDPDNKALTYSWNFGDNTTGAGSTATHVYTAAGSYTATVTVSNGANSATGSVVVTVTVVTYPLTVNNGSGGGSYPQGTVVNISANAPPAGLSFNDWVGSPAIQNVYGSSTTITMPAASTVITATYNFQPPVISPNGGSFANSVAVTLSTLAAGASIFYTTDGSTPTSTTGILYNEPFTLTSNATVNAIVTSEYLPASAAASAAFVVKPAAVINWLNPASITYGTALSATQLGATACDPVTAAAMPGIFAYSPAAGTVLNAGTQTLSVTFMPTDSVHYASITHTVTLNVQPAALAVFANATSLTYGTANPVLPYHYTGMVNNDSSATFAGALATTAAASSGVGTYSISQGTLAATGNYAIGSFTGAVLTVTPAQLKVSADNLSKAYGSPNPPLTDTVSGFQNNDASSAISGAAVLSTTASVSSPVGGYPISISVTGMSAANYTFDGLAGTLTVNPAPLTVTANNLSIFYGQSLPALTYNYSGLVNGDSSAVLSGALATTATAASSAGTYPITAGTLAATGNYTITFNGATLTIMPAIPPSITSARASSATEGQPFSYQLISSGSAPLTFAATNLPAGLSLSGDTISGTPTVCGQTNIALSASNAGGVDNETLVLTIASSSGTPPQPVTTPPATPAPVTAGQPVTLSVDASDTGVGLLTYTWDFGDHSSGGSGASVSHTYANPGVYTAVVTISNGVSWTTQSITVAVNSSGAAAVLTQFTVTKKSFSFNFEKPGSDSISLTGMLLIQAGFVPSGQSMTVMVGGYTSQFNLTSKCEGISGTDSIKLTGAIKNGACSGKPLNFSYAVKKKSLLASLQEYGFSNANASQKAISLPVLIYLDNAGYLANISVSYTAKAGKNGVGK